MIFFLIVWIKECWGIERHIRQWPNRGILYSISFWNKRKIDGKNRKQLCEQGSLTEICGRIIRNWAENRIKEGRNDPPDTNMFFSRTPEHQRNYFREGQNTNEIISENARTPQNYKTEHQNDNQNFDKYAEEHRWFYQKNFNFLKGTTARQAQKTEVHSAVQIYSNSATDVTFTFSLTSECHWHFNQ